MAAVDTVALRELLDTEVRRDCRFGGRHVARDGHTTRIVGPSAHHDDNQVMWSDLDETVADGVIAEVVRGFHTAGKAFEWKLYTHDRPADLLERLVAHGGAEVSRETVVVQAAAEAAGNASPTPGFAVRPVRDGAGVADAVQVQAAVWGPSQTELLTRWLTEMVEGPAADSVVVVAYRTDDDGSARPVGAGWAMTHVDRSFAPLFGGSVLADARGNGLYRAMVAARAAHAHAQGIPWCMVDAGPESHPILHRLGFERITGRIGVRFTP